MQAGLLLLLIPVGAPVTLWSRVICRYRLTEKIQEICCSLGLEVSNMYSALEVCSFHSTDSRSF